MKKENKNIEINKKSSLIKLGLWCIFIVLVLVYINYGNKISNNYQQSEEKQIMNFSKIKQNFLASDLNIEYQINDYYITGTIMNNELNGTLEQNDSIIKIKYNTDLYEVKKKEEMLNNELLNDIEISFLLPKNILKTIDDTNQSAIKSEDEKVYSYQIEDTSYSIYLNEEKEKIEKIIIAKENTTYELSYNYI